MKPKKRITVNFIPNKPFYKFKPVGISLDCTREQIKICHSQCVYIAIARVKAHLHNPSTQ